MRAASVGLVCLSLAGCEGRQPLDPSVGSGAVVARASYYGGGPKRYEPNTHTANGERFDKNGLTAAHRTLPFGTVLRVEYRGRSAMCRVNDRGPAVWTGKSLDLSLGCARAIGMVQVGVATVTYTLARAGR